MADQDEQGLTSQVGPVEVNWPLTVGYYGGIGLALAFDLVAPPVAIFIAAIPFMKMIDRPGASKPTRLVSQVLQGVATPVNGDAPSSIRLTTPNVSDAAHAAASATARDAASAAPAKRPLSILAEARRLADQARVGSPDAVAGQG